MKPGFPPFPFAIWSDPQRQSWAWTKAQMRAWKAQQKASWQWQKQQLRAQRRAERIAARGPFHALFGVIWGLFWVAVIFYLVFGGPPARALAWQFVRMAMEVVQTVFLAARDLLSGLFGVVQ